MKNIVFFNKKWINESKTLILRQQLDNTLDKLLENINLLKKLLYVGNYRKWKTKSCSRTANEQLMN